MKQIILALGLCLGTLSLYSQPVPADFLSALDELDSLIRQHHVSPDWKTSPAAYEEVLIAARNSLADRSACDEACYVELFKLIAAIRDGHSGIAGGTRYELFGYLPISVRWFGEELRVMRAAEQYSATLGHRISAVNGLPIEEVLERLRTVVPHANESRFKKFSGYYLHLPGLLYGLGITEHPDTARFSFANGDQQLDLTLVDLPPAAEDGTTFVSWTDQSATPALYQRQNDRYYWFDYEPDTKLFYLQYNRIGNMDGEGSSAFARRMWAFVDSVEVDRFVLDLRYNGGGSFPYSLRYLQGILDRPSINQRGKLFVITGYETFSAAISLLNELEAKSQAIIIGEIPCDHAAHPGNSEEYQMRSLPVEVNLSSLFHPTVFPNDQRTEIPLDHEIITNWENFRKGYDPVMDFVINYGETPPRRVRAADFPEAIGRYLYSPDRFLLLQERDGELWLEITHALETPLYEGRDGRWETEVLGLLVSLRDGRLQLDFPDGQTATFLRTKDDLLCAVEYLYAGRFAEAEAAYRMIRKRQPDYVELQDHRMSFLASIAYFALLKDPDVDAGEVARFILNLGIELNEGEAPFCEFSLRFY